MPDFSQLSLPALRRAHPVTDAIVVGAGPAGSAAAIGPARAGAKLLLLERARETGDALCGGFRAGRHWYGSRPLGIDRTALGGQAVRCVRLFAGKRPSETALPGEAMGYRAAGSTGALQAAAVAAGAVSNAASMRRHSKAARCRRDGATPTALDLPRGRASMAFAAFRANPPKWQRADPCMGACASGFRRTLRSTGWSATRSNSTCSIAASRAGAAGGWQRQPVPRGPQVAARQSGRRSGGTAAGAGRGTALSRRATGACRMVARRRCDRACALWLACRRTPRPACSGSATRPGDPEPRGRRGWGWRSPAPKRRWRRGVTVAETTAPAFQERLAARMARLSHSPDLVWRMGENPRASGLMTGMASLFPSWCE